MRLFIVDLSPRSSSYGKLCPASELSRHATKEASPEERDVIIKISFAEYWEAKFTFITIVLSSWLLGKLKLPCHDRLLLYGHASQGLRATRSQWLAPGTAKFTNMIGLSRFRPWSRRGSSVDALPHVPGTYFYFSFTFIMRMFNTKITKSFSLFLLQILNEIQPQKYKLQRNFFETFPECSLTSTVSKNNKNDRWPCSLKRYDGPILLHLCLHSWKSRVLFIGQSTVARNIVY